MTKLLYPRRPITILHISDIQVQASAQVKMMESMRYDVKRIGEAFGLKPYLVLVSGDITETASCEQFELASSALKDLADIVGLNPRSVVVIPGNHDVDWMMSKSLTGKDLLEPMAQKWRNYEIFYSRWYGPDHPEGHAFSLDEPWSIFEYPELNLVVFGCNSTWTESHLAGSHYGYMGERQRSVFEDTLFRYSTLEWFRIGALHHNLQPTASDTASLRDRDSFRDQLQGKLNIVFHGHTHCASVSSVDGTPILSTGTASLELEKRPIEIANQYQIVQIFPDAYRVWTRCYSYSMNRWVGDCSVSRAGDSWHASVRHNFSQAFPSRHDGLSPSLATAHIDAGDPVGALAVLACDNSADEATVKLQLLRVRQKFGSYSSKDVDELESFASSLNFTITDRLQYELFQLYIKLLSQDHRFDEVVRLEDCASRACSLLPNRGRGILHRLGIAVSIVRGYSTSSESYFQRAEEISNSEGDTFGLRKNFHSLLTTQTLRDTTRYFTDSSGIAKRDELIVSIVGAQEQYLSNDYNYDSGQGFPLKSSIQNLLAEAAMIGLRDGLTNKVFNRLIAANYLLSRYELNQRAEGFSELLGLLGSSGAALSAARRCNVLELTTLVGGAMQTSPPERTAFIQRCAGQGQTDKVRKMAAVFKILPHNSVTASDWRNLRGFIAEADADA